MFGILETNREVEKLELGKWMMEEYSLKEPFHALVTSILSRF